MRKVLDVFRAGMVNPATMVGAAIFALFAVLGITLAPGQEAAYHFEPAEVVVEVGSTFQIDLQVNSSVPVNVFAGEVNFNPDVIRIKTIDYNTSVADLWVELPWYSNGEGTLIFGGGTTREGGFVGNDTLIKITFETLAEGEAELSLNKPRILKHDGLGTDIQIEGSTDVIFKIADKINSDEIILKSDTSSVNVAKELPSTDLNGDGKQSIADTSIFMLNMTGYDSRYDFNLDGEVGIKDLNILLSK